jgi:hypothetical protein
MRAGRHLAIFNKRNEQMSSSNLAVSMEHTATDLLSEPPRPLIGVVTNRVDTNDESFEVPSVRLSTSFRSRSIVIRDQGFRFFRIR